MKIEFESKDEIRRLATVLQNDIYPAPIIISIEDLLDVCSGESDHPLPWSLEGLHLPIMPIVIKDNKEEHDG